MKFLFILLVIALTLSFILSKTNASTCIETNGDIVCSEEPISPLNTEHKIFLPSVSK